MSRRFLRPRIVARVLVAAGTGMFGVACSSGGGSTTPTPSPIVATVTVTPPTAAIAAGSTAQLSATPKDASGSPLSGRSVGWSSSNAAVATVSAAGLVTGLTAGGPVTISATVSGVAGTASVTVTPVAVAQVTVAPVTAAIFVAGTVPLAATTRDASGKVLAGRVVTWSSSNAALATVSAAGLVTGVAAGGPVTITATSEGITGTAAVTINSAALATVYDGVNNISWLIDANLPATNRFGLPLCSGPGTQVCVNASGSMRYDAAVAWVAAMNGANYLGHSNWQIPTNPPFDGNCGRAGPNGNNFGFGCTASAFATLYNGLGLKSPTTAVPIPGNTVGPFSNIQPYLYWSQSAGPPPSGNFTFAFATGWQGANTLPNFLYALPMIAGKLPGTPAAVGNGLQVNPGGATVYDPMTNITWLANANLAATSKFGLPTCTDPLTPAVCIASDGAMTYAAAAQFIINMNGASYLGQTAWQLPAIDAGCTNYNCGGTMNPMGNLFYTQLGFSQGMTAVAPPNIAVGAFRDIQPYLYWACQAATIQAACQANGPVPNFEWSFSFGSGFEGTDLLANDLYVTVYFVGSNR